MSENSFKSIRNTVIASVIAGVILLFFPVIRGLIVKLFKWVYSGLMWCWEMLVASHSLPGWIWLIAFIFSLIGLVNVLILFKSPATESGYKSYTSDLIYNAKWRWNWVGNNITNLWCFCPHCDATLVYDDSSCQRAYANNIRTDFICENCNHKIVASIPGGNNYYATGVIEREIGRRVRTGHYKKQS
ncbi:hypothetical protein KGP17_20365 [Serratia sp. JSRIV001]|uniref:hypothetical protein n=1 Tax=Serratia sp. JSRIV001 TaxID=2831893 RepID=UPI001CBC98BF|nr:hypothetical protein [Serratia sp. JSRIV001]UAN44769.1 hypothetical protein KGP17_20365 [Serratia sp. JSRIV001]